MRRFRWLIYSLLGVVATAFSVMFSPGSWLNRVLSLAVCSVLSAEPAMCSIRVQISSDRAVGVHVPLVERLGESLAQRSREFDDPPPFGQDPGPDYIRDDFRGTPADVEFDYPIPEPGEALWEETPEGERIVFTDVDGCTLVSELQAVNGELVPHTSVVQVKAGRTCQETSNLLVATWSQDGDSLSLNFRSSPNRKLFIEGLSSYRWTFTFEGITETIEIPNSNQVSNSKPTVIAQKQRQALSRDRCRQSRGRCEALIAVEAAEQQVKDKLGLLGSLGAFGLSAFATGGATIVAVPLYWLYKEMGFYDCSLKFGNGRYTKGQIKYLIDTNQNPRDPSSNPVLEHINEAREDYNCPAFCNEKQASGGSQTVDRVVELPRRTNRRVVLVYETYQVPDRIAVMAVNAAGNTRQLFDSGVVGTRGEKREELLVPDQAVEIVVRALGNRQQSTRWYFKVDCLPGG